MSLILDALRKLDREKASRRVKGMPNIASEILKPDSPRPERRTNRYIVALGLTALVAAGLTYALGVGFKGKPLPTEAPVPPGPSRPAALTPGDSPPVLKPAPSPSAGSPVMKRQAAAVPTPPPSAAKPSAPAAGAPPAPIQQATAGPPKAPAEEKLSLPAPVSVPPPAPRQQVAPVPPPPDTGRAGKSEPVSTPSKVAAPPAGKIPAPSRAERMPGQTALPPNAREARQPGVQAAEESSSTPPTLKITGIVWHEEPSMRRAVINGSFVNEGSTVEGVKVVEILPTKVRFLFKGQPFEISVF